MRSNGGSMRMVLRLAALALIFVVVSIAWLGLGATTSDRSQAARWQMEDRVQALWGEPLTVSAPTLAFVWQVPETRTETWVDMDGKERERVVHGLVDRVENGTPASTTVTMDVEQDIRRKGLVWFPLYDLDFDGAWSYVHQRSELGVLRISWPFPASDGFYDDFVLELDGKPVDDFAVHSGEVRIQIPVVRGQRVDVAIRFRSRGNGRLAYRPAQGVSELEDFSLQLTTDFHDIDFPSGTLSPTLRTSDGPGERITWAFERMLSGKGMGVVVPTPVQPGELAASLAFSAPISLALFMTWVFVLGLLRGVDVHPVNHAFVAGAFFAFHLLFAYTADHLPVEAAFGLSAVVSVGLVITYLVRVVSPRFAVVEAGLAQLVYLVGFALAHFWDGLTGLTLTVIGIGTLFALMQLTSHVRWAEVFAGSGGLGFAKRDHV